MSKDPAFLFYSQDFIVGVQTMEWEDRGKYITILSQMHQQGRMKIETIRFLVGNVSNNLISKFLIDENGFYYNKRLEEEVEKRKSFCKSRRDNGLKGGRPKKTNKPNGKPNAKHMATHMGNENEDENESKDIKEIVDYMNVKFQTNFKHKTKSTFENINGRLSEGYVFVDFKEVIDHKYSQWNGTDQQTYLRPKTLFIPGHFEDYLNDARRSQPQIKNNSFNKKISTQTIIDNNNRLVLE